MHLGWALVALACTSASVIAKPARREYTTHNYYVLEHAPRSGTSVDDIARALGVEIIEQAGELPNHWLVRAPTSLPTSSHTAKRNGDPVLSAYDSLRSRSRSSSLFHRSDTHEALRLSRGIAYLERQVPRQRIKRASPPIPNADDTVVHQKLHDVALALEIRDPEFSKQWHLVNDDYPRNSMNATGVWEMGVTGKGVISALVDDGLDYTSDDLAPNFVCANYVFSITG
jgi:kexin